MCPKVIPWLVQLAVPGETHCRNEWDTVIAVTSQGAAVIWLNNNPHVLPGLPITLRVGGAAPALRHANGMPMLTREFTISNANES